MPPDAIEDCARGACVLTSHVPCLACRYDLYGLQRIGACPECGLAVADTLDASRHDPAWLAGVRSGVQALIVAHYILLGSALCLPFLPLGACFYVLLQLGAAVELAQPNPRLILEHRERSRAAQLIGTGMIGYGATVIAAVASFKAAAVILFAALVCHLVGAVWMWRLFVTNMGLNLSPAAARLGKWTAMLIAVAGGVIVATAGISLLLSDGSLWSLPWRADSWVMLVGGSLAIVHALGLVALHAGSRAVRAAQDRVRAGTLASRADPAVKEVDGSGGVARPLERTSR